MSAKLTSLLLAGVGVVALTGAGPAAAQSADQPAASTASGLEEIVVTARRREEKLQSVPVAVTAYTGEALEEHEIRTSEQFSHIVPSLSLNGPFGNGVVTNIRLRGLPGVATYFAEVPTFLSTSESTSLNGNALFVDMENVQVLKGPQGVSFGLNTTGGAILFEPKRPTDSFEGYAQVTLGDYNRHEVEAAINVPIATDKVLARFVVDHNERDGYTKDLLTGTDYSNLDYWYARASLIVRPFDNFENYTVVDYYWSQDHGPGAVLTYVNPLIAGALLPKIKTDLINQKALGVRTIVGDDPGLNPIQRDQDWRIIDNARWEVTDDITIKNIASYSRAQELQRIDLDGSPEDAINVIGGPGWGSNGAPPDAESYTEEFQVSGKSFDEKLNWVGGGFVSFAHDGGPSAYKTVVFGGLSNNTTFFPADHGPSGRTQGLYAQGVYDLSAISSALEGLSFTAGYRYTWDWRTQFTSTRNPAGTCTALGADSNCVLVQDGAFHAFGWNLSLDYQVTPETLAYVRSSRGYTSGGFNAFGAGPANRLIKPEYDTDLELGVKSDWDIGGVKARTNADAFYVWYTNIQRAVNASFTNAAGQVQIGTLTNNAAAAHIEGIEFEGAVVPVKDFELKAVYSYIYTKYDKYLSLTATGQPLDLSGTAFTNFPKTQFSLTGTYRLPIDDSYGDVSLSATYNWQSSLYFGLVPGDVGAFEPAYDNLDIRIDWKNIMGESFDAAFFMTNAMDNIHRLGSFTIYTSVGTVADLFNEPRMFGVQLRYRFNQGASHEETHAATYTPPPVQPPVAAPAVPKSYLVFFDFDKSDLTPQATQIVDQAARNAQTAKVTRIDVTGHTDTVGSDAYNLRLSQRRAQSVASAMEARGIPASEIAIFAKGKRDLLVPTADGVREPQNRRVEIVYSGGGPTS